MSKRPNAGRLRRTLLPLLIAVPVAVLLAGQLGAFKGQAPSDLGVNDGRLKPPSATRNSVSSQAKLHAEHPQSVYAAIDPLPWLDTGSAASMRALLRVLKAQPRTQIVTQTQDYVHAQARTPWLGFVDDLEFWSNPASRVIELRSASRLGREDLGTNRARIETIRAAYSAASAGAPFPVN